MRITPRGHSCLELSTVDGQLLLDPGAWSDLDGAFAGKHAVLITHQHPDHADQARLPKLVEANPATDITVDLVERKVVAPGVEAAFDQGEHAHSVRTGPWR